MMLTATSSGLFASGTPVTHWVSDITPNFHGSAAARSAKSATAANATARRASFLIDMVCLLHAGTMPAAHRIRRTGEIPSKRVRSDSVTSRWIALPAAAPPR